MSVELLALLPVYLEDNSVTSLQIVLCRFKKLVEYGLVACAPDMQHFTSVHLCHLSSMLMIAMA